MPRRYRRKVNRRRRLGIRRKLTYTGYKLKVSGAMVRPHKFKRIGQLMRIGNSTISGAPIATASGNSSLTVGTATADTLNTQQVGGAVVFKLNSATDFGDFAQLFDRYKITGVKLKFLYQSNIANSDSTSGSNALPLLNYSFDADDADVPTTLDDVQRKQYCHQKILNGNYSFSIFLKPRILKEVYQSALGTGYNSAKATWLDCNNSSIPHYGLKFWINNWCPGATKFHQLTIQPTYYLALKDTR